ncbi:ammonia-forming cytochrome c nitrite reductase subunit c552 [Adlercreutzia aquisgranensis]|uniref:ammonia-forming cytochrome c nitrite reductase subunit c552 n=1 Tax=Adlercreutzia aquisgranensis TaxID=2941323 RepID=UPI00203E77A0|nr:ammonia-forming cytochrome c nitrite reductase subunit c552 [Adlercreutzia aquisgranensis]
MRKTKLMTSVVAFALVGAVAAGGALAGCSEGTAATDGSTTGTPAQAKAETPAQADASTTPAAATGEKTMQDWAEMYPLQYSSYATEKYKDVASEFFAEDGLVLYENKGNKLYRPHGHYGTLALEMGPVARDEEGSLVFGGDNSINVRDLHYDSTTKQWVVDNSTWLDDINAGGYTAGCYACRSSKFDDLYEKYGAAAYSMPMDQEVMDTLNGQMWDCAVCHGDNPGSSPDATLSMFTQLSRDAFDELDPFERVCGQCHNTFNHRSHITDQASIDKCDPYRYGFDIDGLLQAEIEDGIIDIDEATGIIEGCFDEPQLENTQGGNHAELGLTCVDCHMPKTVDAESGETYTDHNASGSPLDKEASLEKCMSCHKSQGIDSTDEMVEMVRGKQRQARADVAAATEKREQAYDLIKAAVEDKTVDEATLQQAKDDYTKAHAYIYICNTDSNGRAVHNPDKLADNLSRANVILDGIIATLS